jgi:hypothetical protein
MIVLLRKEYSLYTPVLFQWFAVMVIADIVGATIWGKESNGAIIAR